MQLFCCPFCGERDEREFFFAGEWGKARPDTTQRITDDQWARYLYDQRNDKGTTREIWIHLLCAEAFLMERDSVTMVVRTTRSLRNSGE